MTCLIRCLLVQYLLTHICKTWLLLGLAQLSAAVNNHATLYLFGDTILKLSIAFEVGLFVWELNRCLGLLLDNLQIELNLLVWVVKRKAHTYQSLLFAWAGVQSISSSRKWAYERFWLIEVCIHNLLLKALDSWSIQVLKLVKLKLLL